jgi:hypothetical protein
MSDWIFPVGHYLGPFVPGRDVPAESHRIRVGDELVKLVTETEFMAWGLAHGLPDAVSSGGAPVSGRVWTRAVMAAIAGGRGTTDLPDAVDGLLALGALVEVGPDAVDPAAFARNHRLRPLLAGLGTTAARPDRYRIGVFGEEPVAVVDAQVFDLWQWAPRVDTLWDLSELQADTAPLLGDDADGVPGLLHRVHTLVANGCGYLDVAATST